jgi:hypothetical protein
MAVIEAKSALQEHLNGNGTCYIIRQLLREGGIGQKENVVVHKFITQDSIEEKIDAMLVDKAQMADEVIASSGEGWITELDNEQLMGLFSLGLT